MTTARPGLRWDRIFFAALLSEVIAVLVFVVIVFVYQLGTPGSPTGIPDQARVDEFIGETGGWVGPLVGGLLTVAFAYWASRGAADRRILHGGFVGVLVAALDLLVLLSLARLFAPAFAVSLAVKILAGFLGGALAEKRASR